MAAVTDVEGELYLKNLSSMIKRLYRGIRARIFYLKVTYCSLLQLFALVERDQSCVQVILDNHIKICRKVIEHSLDLYKLKTIAAKTEQC